MACKFLKGTKSKLLLGYEFESSGRMCVTTFGFRQKPVAEWPIWAEIGLSVKGWKQVR
jgi:hypothetical protein